MFETILVSIPPKQRNALIGSLLQYKGRTFATESQAKRFIESIDEQHRRFVSYVDRSVKPIAIW